METAYIGMMNPTGHLKEKAQEHTENKKKTRLIEDIEEYQKHLTKRCFKYFKEYKKLLKLQIKEELFRFRMKHSLKK